MNCSDEQPESEVKFQVRQTLYWKSGMQSSKTMFNYTQEELQKSIDDEIARAENSGKYELILHGPIVKVTSVKEDVEMPNTRYFVEKTTNMQLPRELRKK